MAKQTINIGVTANDGTGTTLRDGGDLINDNFNEIYSGVGDGSTIQFNLTGATNGQGLTYNSTSNKFEPTDIVTATGSITLENKTIDLANNTLTGSIGEFNAALQSASFTTLSGVEALTNKDLTGSGNTFPALGLL